MAEKRFPTQITASRAKTNSRYITDLLKASKITSSKATHVGRKGGLGFLDIMGTPDADKRKLGQWADGGSMVNNYETIIPRRAIHNIAGFMANETYFLARATIKPSKNLIDQVFPALNELLDADG